MSEPEIKWTGHVPPGQHAAIVLFPWDGVGFGGKSTDAGGTTICYRSKSGELFGCRDVTAGDTHDSIVKAWTDEAAAAKLPIDDQRKKPAS